MSRFVQIVLTIQFALLSALALADDQRLLCGKPVALAPPLTRAQIEDIVRNPVEATQTFEKLAQTYDAALTAEEKQDREAKLFISKVRGAAKTEPAVWDISPDVVNLNQEILFARFDDVVIFDCARQPIPTYKANMAYLAGVVKKLTQPGAFATTKEIKQVIDARTQQADALLKNGLPMWPWENYINGLRLGHSDAEPLFQNQWIVLRPSAAMEFSTRSRLDAKLNGSLAIEPIGFVHYTDRTYQTWWGVSGVVTVSTNAGLGYGALFRYDKFTLGLTLHKSDQPGKSNDVFIMMGIDLYDYLNSKRKSLPLPGTQ